MDVPAVGQDPRVIPVGDLSDPRLHMFTDMTDVALRRVREPAEGIFMAESTPVIARCLAAGYQPLAMLVPERWLHAHAQVLQHPACQNMPIYVGDLDTLKQLTGYNLHRGAVTAMRRRPLVDASELVAGARRIAILENIVDHTNVGAMFRSAAALSMDAVLVTPECADPLYRRSVRVSMGTVFQVPWTRIQPYPEGLVALKEAGFTIAALALGEDTVSLGDLEANPPAKLAFLLGSEGYGLTEQSLRLADLKVTIPMAPGVDSLNVAAASAVAFWATRPRS